MTFTVDEPDELPTALPRDVIFVDCVRFDLHLNKRMFALAGLHYAAQICACGWVRTNDPLITVRCSNQLSYASINSSVYGTRIRDLLSDSQEF